MERFILLATMWLLISSTQYCHSLTQIESLQVKYIAHQNLKNSFHQETIVKVMAVVVSNLLKRDSHAYNQQFHDCLKSVTSVDTYAQCVAPVILRHRERQEKCDNGTCRKKREIYRFKKINKKKVVAIYSEKSETLAMHRRNASVRNSNKLGTYFANGLETQNRQIQDISSISSFTSDLNSIPIVENFTLAPDERINSKQSFSNSFSKIGGFLVDMVRNLKNRHGPWFKFPNIDRTSNNSSNYREKHNDRFETEASLKRNVRSTTNKIHRSVDGLLNSRMLILKDDIISGLRNRNYDRYFAEAERAASDENVHFLSPRFMPLQSRNDNLPTFLSPDFFSLYEGGSNNIASIPSLMAGMNDLDKKVWLRLLSELTGVTDIFKFLKTIDANKILSLSSVAVENGSSLPVTDVFDILDNTFGDLYKTVTTEQMIKLNSVGYIAMNERQFGLVYGNRTDLLKFDVKNFLSLTELEKETLLLESVLRTSSNSGRNENSLLQPYIGGAVFDNKDNDAKVGYSRSKRALGNPCTATPYVGGAFDTAYILAPQILCPSVFSFTIVGAYILSPYILSPYVLGPFILAPEVLSPFILSPYVLSPSILTPVVLSPGILNPLVLSPYILSPFVLSPAVLSPIVLNPNILSPGVLSPSVLSPAVLSPSILSPSVLNPVILSPSVFNPSILSPGLLNPSILSPGVHSPSILSPCAMCRKRRKRSILFNRFKLRL